MGGKWEISSPSHAVREKDKCKNIASEMCVLNYIYNSFIELYRSQNIPFKVYNTVLLGYSEFSNPHFVLFCFKITFKSLSRLKGRRAYLHGIYT